MMTLQIATVLIILGIAMVLFITEKVRMDIVGLLVMVSPAVVTVWAVLILSAGLARTGVATILGDRL